MKIPNSIATFFKRLRGGTQQDPARDWLILIGVSLVVFAGVIVWNVWAFTIVSQGGTIGSSPVPASSAFNRSSLESIQGVFSARATEEQKYVTGVYRYVDPSQ
ncbi:MAG: hypothetical protein WAN50_01215 [Minisyncoccia bacterium]